MSVVFAHFQTARAFMNRTTRTMKEAEGESGGNMALMCLPSGAGVPGVLALKGLPCTAAFSEKELCETGP